MTAADLIRAAPAEPAHPWPRHVLPADTWRLLATEPQELDFLGLWAEPVRVHALFLDGTDVLPVSVPVAGGAYPALSPGHPAAAWFERMVHDLWGHVAEGGVDLRPWLDHGRWPSHAPLAARPVQAGGSPEPPTFLPVEGEDLHQFPLGPVHGIIAEPGHLRITAEGETIRRLEVRLGYAHKGQFALMHGKPSRAAARYVARLSGDSTVAHSIAYARAAEAALATEAPPRAHALRAVMAEIERMANHAGDLARVIGEAGLGVPAAQWGLHREALLVAAEAAFGHRLMMDCVVPGGVAVDLAPQGAAVITAALDAAERELPALGRVLDDSARLGERLLGVGTVDPGLAAAFAAGGYVGRASGRGFDARRRPGYPPYDGLDVAVPVLEGGDAAARLRIRLRELEASAGLLRRLLGALPEGRLTLTLPMASGEGIGVAEGFRGDVWHWLRLDGGLVAGCFARDPSWLHWPLLERAMQGGAIGDLAVCAASFNCACSGVDL